MKKLIAYYSRADENYFQGKLKYIQEGNTKKVALMIQKLVSADLFEIRQKDGYASDYQTCIAQAKKDKENNARPELVSLMESLDEYDEIYLGYPNYWGDMPMAIYTFLEAFDFKGKKIHPFCTHEGSGLSSTENKLKSILKEATIEKGIAIRGSDVNDALSALEKWIG